MGEVKHRKQKDIVYWRKEQEKVVEDDIDEFMKNLDKILLDSIAKVLEEEKQKGQNNVKSDN